MADQVHRPPGGGPSALDGLQPGEPVAQVLQLLAKYRVTATFSMVGLQVAAHPAMAREVAPPAPRTLVAPTYWTRPRIKFEVDA